MVLNIDSPGSDGFFRMHAITPTDYGGATGDGTLDLVGFDVEVVSAKTLRFWFINQRPPVDADRNYLAAELIGANVTIDVFELRKGEKVMKHVKTFADPAVYSPNGIAVLGNGSFMTSNDHSGKVGIRKVLDVFLGGGNIAFCPSTGPCAPATPSNLMFPNGLIRGQDGLIYVPSSITGAIKVMQLTASSTLKLLDIINIGMPLDNLAVDKSGDIWAAAFPKLLQVMDTVKNPFSKTAISTVWRIRKEAKSYEVKKILEDKDAKVLSGVTTARHDVKTGRIFMGSALTPYMMVCDPRLVAEAETKS